MKKYIALLTQVGAGDPVITVLRNSLGVDPTIIRRGPGLFRVAAQGSMFLEATTTFSLAGLPLAPGDNNSYGWDLANTGAPDYFEFNTKSGGVETDGLLAATRLEIEVF